MAIKESITTEYVSHELTQEQNMKKWQIIPSELSQLCNNPIRKIVENINIPETSEAKPLIPLSLGDPTVFGNLSCPEVLTESIVRNVRSMKHNGYVHSAGTEAARQAIATKFGHDKAKLTIQDIIITSGCSSALEIAITGLLNAGENILLPNPGFPLYQVICDARKIECKFYNLQPHKQWEVDLQHLESLINTNTKAIIVNNPSNPCGSVYSKQHLQAILSIAEAHKLPIISDEVYHDLVFKQQVFYPIASLTTTVPVIAVSGLAKLYVVPGWRLGWIAIHDRNNKLNNVRNGYFKLSQMIMGANTLVQSCLPDILTPIAGSKEKIALDKFKTNYISTLDSNAQYTLQRLQQIETLDAIPPQGAMYVMVRINTMLLNNIKDDCEFTQKLLDEEAVFVLPGQCFGMTNFIRIVISAPHDVLEDAFNRLEQFCTRHKGRPQTLT